MKLHYLFFSLLILFSSILSAQESDAKLSGKVIDEDGEPMMAVSVVIDASKGWGAITDFDGNYEISIPAGTYDVTFKDIRKETLILKVTLTSGQTTTQNATLREKTQIMDEVVVTGNKYETRLAEQPISMDVLKGRNLTNQNITNLEQGMTRVPGVTIADGQVNIRGGAGWS